MNAATHLPDIPLPPGIRARCVDNINGLRMHVLEAGFETRGRPCVLLLHGFPELGFSWRKVMPTLAAWCALVRPDVFRSVVLMSAPFAGPPPLPFDTLDTPPRPKPDDPVHRELAALLRPRKHYQWYYSTRQAN